MSDGSIVMDVVSLVSVPLSSIVRPVLQCVVTQFSDTNKISKDFIRFLKQIPCRHTAIDQIADKCAAVSFAKLSVLFGVLNHAFPTISLDMNEPIADEESMSEGILARLAPIRDNSLLVRAVLFYVLDAVKADMIFRIVTKIDRANRPSGDVLFDFCFGPFLAELKSPLVAKVRLINADRWERIMYMGSVLTPITTFSYLLDALKEDFACPAQKTFLFKILRSVQLKNINIRWFDAQQVRQYLFDQIELVQTQQISGKCADACILFLGSILSQLLVIFDGVTSHPILTMLLHFANAGAKKNSVYAVSLLVSFFLYSNTVRKSVSLQSLVHNTKQFWSVSTPLVIDAFARILCGPNFCVHYEEVCPGRFIISRMDPRDVKHIPVIFDAFMSKSMSFCDCREEVTRFLIHLALNDFKFFVGTCLPKLTQTEFLNVNATAFFDAVLVILTTPLFTQSYRKDMLDFKSQVRDRAIFFLVETDRKLGSYVFNVESSDFDPSAILESSEPQKVVLPTMRRFQSDINKWKKAMLRDEDNEIALFNSFPSTPLQTPVNLRLLDTHLAHCLTVVPLLPYSDNLVAVVLQFVADEEVYLATIAVKVFVAIGVANPEKSQDMLRQLLNLDIIESNEQLYMRIQIATIFLKSVKVECPNWIAEFIVVGLCSNSFEVRNAAFALAEFIPCLSEFLNQKSKKIFNLSLAKVSRLLTSGCDEKALMMLPFRSVKELGSSNYEMLYHIFLSIVFTEDEDQRVITLFQQTRPAIMKYVSKDSIFTPMYLVNLCTFVVATSTAGEPSQIDLNSIIMRAIKAVIENGDSFYCVLISFASSVNQERVYPTISMFTGPNEIYKRIFLSMALLNWRKSDEGKKAGILKLLFEQCESIIMFFDAAKYVSMTKVEPVSYDMLRRNGNLMCSCLCDFTTLAQELCDFYAESHRTEPIGPFLRKPYVAKELDRKNWLIFLLNLTQLPPNKELAMLANSAKMAFASFCGVATIPPELESAIDGHIGMIVRDNIEAASNILSQSYQVMLGSFISQALVDCKFFVCIAKQFEDISDVNMAKALLQKRMNGKPSQVDQMFTDVTLSHMGQLLALSLYFLAGDQKGYESSALRILNNMIISAAVLRKNDMFIPLLVFLGRKSHGDHLSFRSMYHLSRRMSTAFLFCAEPFLLQAMSMEYSHSFCCLLEPWFKNARLSYGMSAVIPKCEQKCFNSFTFMSIFLNAFCQERISPPVIDLITKFGDVELVFVLALSLSRTQKQECMRFLTYLCSVNNRLLDFLSQILEFRFWYFQMIQLSQYDRAFDIDAFLSDMEDVKGKESVVTKPDVDVDGFDGLTSFALLLSLELINASSVAKEKLTPFLLSFCWITKCEQASYVLEQLLGSGNQSIEAIIHFMSATERGIFAKSCFEWAVSCGRIPMAYDATVMTLSSIHETSIEKINIVLRSLKICVMTLDEIEQWKSKPKPKDFMKVHYQSDMSQFYGYVANLVRLLSKLNLFLKSPTQKAIKTICEFLKCHGSKEYTVIFQAAVDSLYDHVAMSTEMIDIHDSSQGIIADVTMFDMILENTKASESMEKLCEIIFMLVKAGSFDVLLRTESPKSAISLAVIVVLPYCVGNATKLDDLVKAVSKYFHTRSLVTAPVEAVKAIIPSLTASDMTVAIKFFTGMIEYIPEYSSSVYSVCSQLLLSETGPSLFEQASKISLKALREREKSNSESACEFLSVYQRIGDVQTYQEIPKKIPFPPILVDSSFTVTDIDSSTLPPLIPLDSNFNYLHIVNEMRQKGSAMEIEPFTHWFRSFYSMDSVQVVCPSVTGVTWSPKDFDEFCTLLMKSDAKKLSSRKSSAIKQATDRESMSERLLSIDSTLFLPTRAEVASICPNFDFPL